MASHFQRGTIRQIVSGELHGLVLIHAKIDNFVAEHPGMVLVSDCGIQIIIDFANIEGATVEKNEYYRFLGETDSAVRVSSFVCPKVRLHIEPRRCDGYDSSVYERCLVAKRSFLEGFDGLIGYAIKRE